MLFITINYVGAVRAEPPWTDSGDAKTDIRATVDKYDEILRLFDYMEEIGHEWFDAHSTEIAAWRIDIQHAIDELEWWLDDYNTTSLWWFDDPNPPGPPLSHVDWDIYNFDDGTYLDTSGIRDDISGEWNGTGPGVTQTNFVAILAEMWDEVDVIIWDKIQAQQDRLNELVYALDQLFARAQFCYQMAGIYGYESEDDYLVDMGVVQYIYEQTSMMLIDAPWAWDFYSQPGALSVLEDICDADAEIDLLYDAFDSVDDGLDVAQDNDDLFYPWWGVFDNYPLPNNGEEWDEVDYLDVYEQP